MKITQENFNKLPQLDRIEYRQRDDRVRSIQKGSVFVTIFSSWAFVFGFILLMYVGLLNISAEIAIRFLSNIYLSLMNPLKYSLFLAILIDVAIWFYKFNLLSKLNKEYFKPKRTKKK